MGRKINEELKAKADSLTTETGKIITDKIMDATIKTVFKEFLQHPDLGGAMNGDAGEILKEKIRIKLQNSLSGLIARLTNKFSALRKELQTTVDITLIADEMKEYPSEMIQNLHFKIGNNSMDIPVADEVPE